MEPIEDIDIRERGVSRWGQPKKVPMLHVDELPIEALYPSLFRREGNIEFGVFSHQVDDDLRSQVAASWDELGAKTFSTLSASGSLTRVQLLILRADLGRLELEAAAVLRSLVTS